MRLDPVKLVKHRQHLGYSQQNVADKSSVNVRTVQRAEAGVSVSNENAASLAAALQTTPQALLLEATQSDVAAPLGKTITLRRASSGRSVIDMLDQTAMCKIECDVEPTKDKLDLLKQIANLLEENMPEPLNEQKQSWPPRRTLAERLDLIANLNEVLGALEALGIGVFFAETWLDAYLPDYDPYEGGFYWRKGHTATGCRAARIVISGQGTDKIVRQALVNWPISIAIDDDDEAPF